MNHRASYDAITARERQARDAQGESTGLSYRVERMAGQRRHRCDLYGRLANGVSRRGIFSCTLFILIFFWVHFFFRISVLVVLSRFPSVCLCPFPILFLILILFHFFILALYLSFFLPHFLSVFSFSFPFSLSINLSVSVSISVSENKVRKIGNVPFLIQVNLYIYTSCKPFRL